MIIVIATGFLQANICVANQKSKVLTVQVGQTRTCFSFIADRWFPVANTSVDHLIKIQEYAESGNIAVCCSSLIANIQ